MEGSGATFTDSSSVGRSITAFGNSTQSTAQSRFGSKSWLSVGGGDYLSFGSGSTLTMGTGDFTIEMWLRLNSYATAGLWESTPIGGQGSRFTGFIWYLVGGGTVHLFHSGTNIMTTASAIIPLSQWSHVALSRASGTTRMYVDGLQVASTTSSYDDTAAGGTIGAFCDGASNNIDGYIDEVRVTRGVARYSGSTLTVPTAAFPDSGPAFSDPSSLAPTLWLDASVSGSLYDATSGGSLVGSGGTVRRWEDQSGNGNHVTGSTGPTRSVNSINNRDSLAFSSQILTRSTLNLSSATAASLFAVIKFATSGNQIAVAFGTDASYGGLTLEANLRTGGSHSATFGSNAGASENSAVGGTVSNSTRSLGAVYGSSTGTLYIGGSSTATVSRSQSLNSSSGFSVGAFFSSGFALSGNICEIVYVPRAMTSSEISALQAYFATKWGV
jgi:hypothetical protein